MGAVGAASSGSETGGGADGWSRTTVIGSAGMEYQWSHASVLEATVAYRVASDSTALRHLAVLLLDILR